MTTKTTYSPPAEVFRSERDGRAIRLVGFLLVRATSAEGRLARRLRAQG